VLRDRSRSLPTGLALADAPAETLEGFEEEGADVARLKAASLRSLHVFADLRDALGAQRLADEGAFFAQGAIRLRSTVESMTRSRRAFTSGLSASPSSKRRSPASSSGP